MAENDSVTLQKIMAEGKKEFLQKGFKDASLRNIVKRAGVTTGAFYGYYQDKQALFNALVSPAAHGLKELFLSAHDNFQRLPGEVQKKVVYNYTTPHMNEMIDFIYTHFDEFKLLITCAGGTAYSDYVNGLVGKEVESTEVFMESTGNDALSTGRVTPELMHIISSAYFTAVFEIVAHDMPRKAAESYVRSLTRFFTAGWKTVLDP